MKTKGTVLTLAMIALLNASCGKTDQDKDVYDRPGSEIVQVIKPGYSYFSPDSTSQIHNYVIGLSHNLDDILKNSENFAEAYRTVVDIVDSTSNYIGKQVEVGPMVVEPEMSGTDLAAITALVAEKYNKSYGVWIYNDATGNQMGILLPESQLTKQLNMQKSGKKIRLNQDGVNYVPLAFGLDWGETGLDYDNKMEQAITDGAWNFLAPTKVSGVVNNHIPGEIVMNGVTYSLSANNTYKGNGSDIKLSF